MNAQQPRASVGKTKVIFPRVNRALLTPFVFGAFLVESVSVQALEWESIGDSSWWLLAGYTFNASAGGRDGGKGVEIGAMYPTWTSRGVSHGRWRADPYIEGLLGSRVNGEKGVLVGLGPGVRLGYLFSERPFPYLVLSLGVTYNDMDLYGMGTRFNFSQQVGSGLEYRFGKRFHLRAEYRFMHMSNAGLSDQNAGLNTQSVLAGLLHSF